jgi:hypothetical protein
VATARAEAPPTVWTISAPDPGIPHPPAAAVGLASSGGAGRPGAVRWVLDAFPALAEHALVLDPATLDSGGQPVPGQPVPGRPVPDPQRPSSVPGPAEPFWADMITPDVGVASSGPDRDGDPCDVDSPDTPGRARHHAPLVAGGPAAGPAAGLAGATAGAVLHAHRFGDEPANPGASRAGTSTAAPLPAGLPTAALTGSSRGSELHGLRARAEGRRLVVIDLGDRPASDRLGLHAAALLAPGGVLAVLTHSAHRDGVLVDHTGSVVVSAQHADLLYLQHIVVVPHLLIAPPESSEDRDSDDQLAHHADGPARVIDLLLFTRPTDPAVHDQVYADHTHADPPGVDRALAELIGPGSAITDSPTRSGSDADDLEPPAPDSVPVSGPTTPHGGTR